MSNYAGIVSVTAAVTGQIKVGLVKQAAIRSVAVVASGDQRELALCKQVITGPIPDTWVQMVLIELDIATNSLTAPTDAQIDTVIATGVASPAVASVWSFLIASRG